MSTLPVSGTAPENSFKLGTAFIGASDAELALSIALVVFIILTALLTLFIVLLFNVPKFRALFFKSDDKGNVETKKKRSRTETKKRTEKRQPQAEKDSARRLVYSDSVPTVPLDGATTPITGDEDMLQRTNDAYVALALATAPKRSTASSAAASAKSTSTAKNATPVKSSNPTAASAKTASTAKTPAKSAATAKTASAAKTPAKSAAKSAAASDKTIKRK